MDDAAPPLSLEVYAHVVAALGEGYGLDVILTHEGISEDLWGAAEEHWVGALDESVEGDLSLHDEMDRALWRGRKRFARPVPPLDDDIGAFMTFQLRCAKSERLADTLREHGLTLGDWVRLGELWAERLSVDEGLRAEASKVLPTASEAPMPEVIPSPRVLPPPLFGARGEIIETEGEATHPPAVPWGLDGLVPGRPAAPPVEVRSQPVDARAQPGKPSEEVAPPPRLIEAQAPPPPSPPPPLSPVAAIPPSFSDLLPNLRRASYLSDDDDDDPGTLLGAQPGIAPVLPFQAASKTAPPVSALMDDDESAPTLSLADHQRKGAPALPFRERAVPKASPYDDQGGSGTLPSQSSPLRRGAALPFAREAEDEEPASATLIEPSPLRTGADMPFHAPPAAAPIAPPVAPEGPASGDGPLLSLEQYAALCAEIAAFPSESEAAFARYGLASRPVRFKTDFVWRERLRTDPALDARYRALYSGYYAHITTRGRGGG